MARTHYQRGADRERRILNKFLLNGWIGARSAGSHSIIDIWVLEPEEKKIVLIQSKLNGKENLSKPERERILTEGRKLNGTYEVEFQLWD
jgi:Holliday junction resolvase